MSKLLKIFTGAMHSRHVAFLLGAPPPSTSVVFRISCRVSQTLPFLWMLYDNFSGANLSILNILILTNAIFSGGRVLWNSPRLFDTVSTCARRVQIRLLLPYTHTRTEWARRRNKSWRVTDRFSRIPQQQQWDYFVFAIRKRFIRVTWRKRGLFLAFLFLSPPGNGE